MSNRCSHSPARVIARQPIFASLPESECEGLVRRSVCRAIRRGEILFREGESCRGLYLVVEGAVKTYRASADGHEQVLGVFGVGESLGEVSLFDEGPYLASARVAAEGRVLFLPLGEVQALYDAYPKVARAVVRELGERIRSLTSLVDQLALRDVPTRVAAAVLKYAEESEGLGTGVGFRLPRTQEELAAELGTTREGVSRALRSLRDDGVIGQKGARVRVLDPGRLREIAGRSRNGPIRRRSHAKIGAAVGGDPRHSAAIPA